MAQWEFGLNRHGTLTVDTFEVGEVLYEFDEPLIFRAKVGPLDCLLNKVSSRNGGSYYLAAETKDDIISALKDGNISVRGAFLSKSYWIFFWRFGSKELAYWRIDHSDLPKKFLPKTQRPLYYWQNPAPDSLAQAESIFSIKFSGQNLNDKSISLGRLRSLVDKSFVTVRALLTPLELQNSRSSTLDFDCQIALSSFVVAVKSPIVNMQAVRRRSELSDLTQEGIESGVRYQGYILGEKIKEMSKAATVEGEMEKYAAENFLLTAALSELMPNEDSFFDAVEFSASQGKSVNVVTFKREAAIAVKSALVDIESRPIIEKGKIVGGSEKTRTVRIMSFRGRQVTCKFSPEQFELVAPEGKLDLSRYLSMRGILTRRERVDYMQVQEFEFFNPKTLI
ncbi:hypothetical protein SAMN05877809_10915 [Rhodobacter sp. JA431]|uniref:hypothetical protein n=1 Tax=Rhodobacter sp. JA431 TaxID=570013 RepID=UPI000BD9FFCE|nr:hypothetical protein [Rhodobacter sp. JA431]SOC16884.1 hypothetical protein SAMN05877809_10915 [Rhodobacter sp. JA431]